MMGGFYGESSSKCLTGEPCKITIKLYGVIGPPPLPFPLWPIIGSTKYAYQKN
jgi:hypothetical protein